MMHLVTASEGGVNGRFMVKVIEDGLDAGQKIERGTLLYHDGVAWRTVVPAAAGTILWWDMAASAWKSVAPPGNGALLRWDGAAWATIMPTANGNILWWNGTNWVAVTPTANGSILLWNGSSWVVITPSADRQQILRWNGSSWTLVDVRTVHVNVYRSAAMTLTHNTPTPIVFDAVNSNVGGTYNTVDGFFTAPIRAFYDVSTAVMVSGAAANSSLRIQLRHYAADGSTLLRTWVGDMVWTPVGGNFVAAHLSLSVELPANEKLRVEALLVDGAATNRNVQTGAPFTWLQIVRTETS